MVPRKILKVTFFNHLASFSSLLISAGFFIGILFWLKFDPDALKIFGAVFIIDAAPSLYLHFEYWLMNKNVEYEINDSEIIQIKQGKETIYKNQDIEKIVVYLTPDLYKNSNFHLLAIGGYHYAKIFLKTGDELVVTCLLTPRVDLALKQIGGVLFERKKRLFCSID